MFELNVFIFLCFFVGLIFWGAADAKRRNEESEQRVQQQQRQAALDTAMRGVALDMQRAKAGVPLFGFHLSEHIREFVAAQASPDAVVPVQQPSVIASSAPADAADVGEVLDADSALPTAEVTALVPERILSVELAAGVHGVIGFYANESVVIRTIHVSDPAKFNLPSADYSAGNVVPGSRTDEQLLSDATALLPGVFLQIVTDPSTEEALRIRVS